MAAEMMRFARQVFAAVLIIGLVAAIAYSIQILLLVFAGVLLAVLLRGAGTWLHHHIYLSIRASMVVVLIAFGVMFFGSIWLFGVQIANQADQLFSAVSQAYAQFHEKLANYRMAGSLSPSGAGLNLEAPARAAASGFLSLIASVVMVLFLGLYLSIDPGLYTGLSLSFFNRDTRARVAELLDEIASALRWWLAGQLISMAIVGVITIAGLLMIGAPMAISLGVLAGLLTFVPYVGTIVSAIPAILLAFTKDIHTAMYVVLIYLVAHVVVGYIVNPLIQHRLVYLPPALILAAQFLAELFAGTTGVTFATPLMVVGMVLIKELYFKQDWTKPTEEAA